jgi:hypothetical protein
MTEKETVIRLYKSKATKQKKFDYHTENGVRMSGFSFMENKKQHYVGIKIVGDDVKIGFNDLLFQMNAEELGDINDFLVHLEEQRKNDNLKDLAEIASKENLDISRRVLTEKHTKNTNFKF